ncbi:MAG TPA: nucleoid-associated protein, partial [Candidatus Angelobacter sp.]
MITAQELATMVVRHVIFHDVPKVYKSSTGVTPTLADVETDIDATRKALLRTKLTQVLGSQKAYPVEFNPKSASPVPEEVRRMTKHFDGKVFVEASQKLASYLFEQQIGSISPGLLCVIDVAVSGMASTVLMKLEREEGAQLELANKQGKKMFAMSVLDNLVLTEGTRLFKSAMFVRTGKEDNDFRVTACDSQLSVTSSSDLAKFWLRFLGCMFLVEPRVATQQFFDSAVRFVNDAVTDPVVKSEIYDSL